MSCANCKRSSALISASHAGKTVAHVWFTVVLYLNFISEKN